MKLRYNQRIYPTPGQQRDLARFFGCARVVYNDGLRARREAFRGGEPYISDVTLQKMVITGAKKTPEREWLCEAPSVCLVQSLQDLHTAYRNFFASKRGARTGPMMVDRWFPSTQMCSVCGSIEGPKGLGGLSVRSWACSCGAVHDRDGNAESNIRAEGRRILAAGRAER